MSRHGKGRRRGTDEEHPGRDEPEAPLPEALIAEGGVAPGIHGIVPDLDSRLAGERRRQRARELTRAGAGGLEPGVHGRMVTDEEVLWEDPYKAMLS